MTDIANNPTVLPEVELTEIALSGQPDTDKGYQTPSGLKFRARIVTRLRQATSAPARLGADFAPSGVNLSLTLAVLADDMTVAKDSTGALLITNVHEIVWGDEAHANPNFDPAADLMTVLRQQAAVLETRMTKRDAVANALADWGGAPLIQSAGSGSLSPAPLMPATTSTTADEMASPAPLDSPAA